MRMILTGLASALAIGATASPALADCTCRAPGLVAKHGQTICLQTPSGPRLARCEMVLNNSSWKFLADACPQALRAGGNVVAAAQTLAPAAPALR